MSSLNATGESYHKPLKPSRIMNLRSAIRAAVLPRGKVKSAIAERARCCPRPNVRLAECKELGTNAEREYWERIAARFISMEPDNADGWIVLGDSRFHSDNFEGACKAYRVAAKLKDNADTWFSLGLSARGEERIAAYRTALNHAPSDSLSSHYLGDALAERGDYETAIQYYETAIENGDETSASWVLCDLALCHLAFQHEEDAIAAFERSIRADNEDSQGKCNYRYVFDVMLGNIADACMNAPPSFAETLHARLMPIAPPLAEKLSKFIKTRTGLHSNSPCSPGFRETRLDS